VRTLKLEFKDLQKDDNFNLPLLSELLNKECTITDVSFDEGSFGDYAIIKLDDGLEYRTSSKVVLKQLLLVQQQTNNKIPITCTLRKIKNYYMLK